MGKSGPITAAFLASAVLSSAQTDSGDHISARYYWFAEKVGRLESSQLVEGIVRVSIFEHHGPQRGWLTAAERDESEAKRRGYGDAFELFMAMLRSVGESERRWGMERLAEMTHFSLATPHAWQAFYDENGDFLIWDDASGRMVVDVERKRAGVSEAWGGLQLSLESDQSRYLPGDPLWLTVSLENVSRDVVRADAGFGLGGGLRIELRRHRPDDVSYVHYRAPPKSAAGEGASRRLAPGERLEYRYDHGALLETPLAPGRYTVQATYERQIPQPPPRAETAWGGKLRSLRLFIDVLDEEGKRRRVFRSGLSYASGEIVWQEHERVLDAARHDFEHCVANEAGVSGRLELEWTLAPEGGAVTGSRIRSDTVGSATLAGCVLAVLHRLRFPAPLAGEPSVSSSLTFTR